jgi:transposase InsO family protein
MPAPKLPAASRGTAWSRRLASSTTIDAAQISPSTVNGSNRAVTPPSPCDRTSSNACWSWDITKLHGPVKWTYYYLYVILDIYSAISLVWVSMARSFAGSGGRVLG